MKKILVVLLAAIVGISAVNAQPTKKQLKAVKSEVAAWTAEGWKVAPGNSTMAEQIIMQKEYAKKVNNEGEPLYVFGESTAVGQTFKAAQLSVMRGVKMNALEQLDTEITAIIQNDLANKQQNLDKAVSVDKVLNRTKEVISNRLPRGIKVVTVYRELKTKNVEVRAMYAYNYDKVHDMLAAAASEALEKEIDEMVKGN
ncbi:MAG: hypothetical protein E7143_05545 [Rikenellaceae bacterium]|nr:hypothetical protein [Rikenellaceae bacterium]